MRDLISMMSERIKDLTEKVDDREFKIKQGNQQNKMVAALEAIPGIGPLTASAMIATIGDFKAFRNGRELAAYLGVVSRQHSSGGEADSPGDQ